MTYLHEAEPLHGSELSFRDAPDPPFNMWGGRPQSRVSGSNRRDECLSERGGPAERAVSAVLGVPAPAISDIGVLGRLWLTPRWEATPKRLSVPRVYCLSGLKRIALQDVFHFLKSWRKRVVVARWQREDVLCVAAELGWPDRRRPNMEITLLERVPLEDREYHDGNVLPLTLRSPLRVPDVEEGPCLSDFIRFCPLASRSVTFPLLRDD